jgi:hypothetical protein
MSEPVDMEKARAKKAEKCPFCGELKHEAEYSCPRIESVTFYNDPNSDQWDSIEIRLRDPEVYEPPLAG